MTMEEAETLALQTLKQVMEEKIGNNNVELAAVEPVEGPAGTTTVRFRLYKASEIETVLKRLK